MNDRKVFDFIVKEEIDIVKNASLYIDFDRDSPPYMGVNVRYNRVSNDERSKVSDLIDEYYDTLYYKEDVMVIDNDDNPFIEINSFTDIDKSIALFKELELRAREVLPLEKEKGEERV